MMSLPPQPSSSTSPFSSSSMTEDAMDLGPFLQTYVLKNPFSKPPPNPVENHSPSSATVGVANGAKRPVTAASSTTGGVTNGAKRPLTADKHYLTRVPTSMAAILSENGCDLTTNVKIAPQTLTKYLSSQESENHLSPSNGSSDTLVDSGCELGRAKGTGYFVRRIYKKRPPVNSPTAENGGDLSVLRDWLLATYECISPDDLTSSGLLAMDSVLHKVQRSLPQVTVPVLNQVLVNTFPSVVVCCNPAGTISYGGLAVRRFKTSVDNASDPSKAAYEAGLTVGRCIINEAVNSALIDCRLTRKSEDGEISSSRPSSTSNDSAVELDGTTQAEESTISKRKRKVAPRLHTDPSKRRLTRCSAATYTDNATKQLVLSAFSSPDTVFRSNMRNQSSVDSEDSIDLEQMLQDVPSAVHTSSTNQQHSSDVSDLTKPLDHETIMSMIRNRATRQIVAKRSSDDECVASHSDSTVSVDCGEDYRICSLRKLDETKDGCKLKSLDASRSPEVKTEEISGTSECDCEDAVPLVTGIYRSNQSACSENDDVELNLCIKSEVIDDHVETTKVYNLTLDRNEVERRRAAAASVTLSQEDEGRGSPLVAHLKNRLEHSTHELAMHALRGATLERELESVRDLNLSLQEELNNRDFHIAHLADDFFKLHRQFKQLARQFQLVLGETGATVTRQNGDV